MKTHVPITHIMTSQVLTVDKNTSLSEVEGIMKRKHIRHLPVVNGAEVVGIISLTDLQRLSYTSSFSDEEVDDEVAIMELLSLDQVMVSKPFTVQKTATVGDVTEILIRMDFHAIPVMDGKELIGIVTSTDLLKYFTGKM